ncbi:MAG: ABC transporter ATP-binding protein/permease [Clostridia bacterium]|nr:ABC transporter ATP-binding protein/permease [Clostridia bacterium]
MKRNMAFPKGKIKKGTGKRLLHYTFKYYKPQLFIVLICLLISAGGGLVSSLFMSININDVMNPGRIHDFEFVKHDLTRNIIIMASAYLIAVLSNFAYNRIMAVVTQGVLYHVRKDMFEKMQSLPIKYFDTHAHGEIMSSYTNDTDALRQLVGQSIPTLISSGLTLIVAVALMLWYSFILTAVFLICSIAMFVIIKKIGGRSAKYMVAQQRSIATEEGYIEELIKGQKVVKVFTHESETKQDFDKLNENLYEDAKRAHLFGNILAPILGNIGNFNYVFLAIVGGILFSLKTPNLGISSLATGITAISFGFIIPFLGMSRRSTQAVNEMSQQVSMIAMGLAGASRIFELMDETPEQDEGYVTLVRCKILEDGTIVECAERTGHWAWKHPHKADGTTTYTELKGDIQMVDVDFGYVEDRIVLKNVSLYAHPGQKVAFVGATGAGKTTITNLINRFYDIADGKIRYDGININKIKKADLRKSLGIVLQDTNLFTGTVMENIRYGRLSASDEDCINAAKLAYADDFITRLPDGYNTMLTADGANLSQGQRQLLSIARAAVKDAPVMILDEATSSIDTRTEALVQKGTDRLMEGRTVFVIAHRLSTVQNSDVIMVLDHGKIIERGSHEQLIAQKGNYYQLYTGAFELE